jgi:hypothetical protein
MRYVQGLEQECRHWIGEQSRLATIDGDTTAVNSEMGPLTYDAGDFFVGPQDPMVYGQDISFANLGIPGTSQAQHHRQTRLSTRFQGPHQFQQGGGFDNRYQQ